MIHLKFSGVALGVCSLLMGMLPAQTQTDSSRRSPNSRARTPNGPGNQGGQNGGPNRTAVFPIDFRSIDASDNHRGPEAWGQADEPFVRRVPSAYSDGAAAPSGSQRPNPRLISNLVCDQEGSIPNPQAASDFVWVWGQFLDHDITETPFADPRESFDIPVPLGDSYFDPLSTGTQVMPLDRSSYDTIRGRREQVNEITAYIDGSQVYGSDSARALALRTLDGTGRLRLLTLQRGWFPQRAQQQPHALLRGRHSSERASAVDGYAHGFCS